MNSSKFRLTLDLHSVQSQYSIPVMVGDTNVTLLISITDGGIPYKITDGCLAKLSIKRPTGTHLVEFCKVKNNAVIEYPFSQNEDTCAEEGIHHCDVTLYSPDGAKVGGPRFTMVVSEMVVRRDDIKLSEDDYTLVKAIEKVEAERQHAEFLREKAEGDRVKAEAERVAAEAKRGDITKYALKAEESASRAEKAAEGIEDCEERVSHNEKRLTNIEKGYSDDFFITDDTSAAIKLVPSNVAPYAEIKKLYGVASKANNGKWVANKPIRIEVCEVSKASVLDATLDLSDMADTMTVEKLEDGSFRFNGYTSDHGNGGTRKFATVELPTGTYNLSYNITSNSSGVVPNLYIYTTNGYEQLYSDMVVSGGSLTLLIDIDIGSGLVAEDLIISFEALKGTLMGGDFVGELIPKAALVIPDEVVEMRGYGVSGNWIDFEAGVFHLAREIVDGAAVSVDPVQDIDIREHIGYDNFLTVEPNDYIRVIREGEVVGQHKTVIVYMKGAN